MCFRSPFSSVLFRRGLFFVAVSLQNYMSDYSLSQLCPPVGHSLPPGHTLRGGGGQVLVLALEVDPAKFCLPVILLPGSEVRSSLSLVMPFSQALVDRSCCKCFE